MTVELAAGLYLGLITISAGRINVLEWSLFKSNPIMEDFEGFTAVTLDPIITVVMRVSNAKR